jgi:hypothetical protein
VSHPTQHQCKPNRKPKTENPNPNKRYAEPEHAVEDAVAAGDLEGSMYGLKRNRDCPTGDGTGCAKGDAESLPLNRLQQAWGDWPARGAPEPGRAASGGEEAEAARVVVS